MGNCFNYRCPKCGNPDEIEIYAFIPVRLTSDGPEIADEQYIDGSWWSSENAAGCDACGYEGAVKDFAAASAGVVSLHDYRRRR
jgi:hypothetical protein